MWRRVLIRYLALIVAANLAWELALMPLYTVWQTGPPGEIAFAIVHCTGGDALIALAMLTLAIIVAGRGDWPSRGYWQVAALATALGLAYTVYSEWLNAAVRHSWTYADAMPVVPPFRTGLAPLMQWLLLPPLGVWWARRIRDI